MMTNTAFYFRYAIQRYLFIKKHDVILWIVSFGVKARPTFISKPSVHVSGLSCWCIFPDWQWSAKLSCALNMSTFEGCCRTAPNSCHLTNAHVSVANPTRTVTTHRINFSSPCCCFKRASTRCNYSSIESTASRGNQTRQAVDKKQPAYDLDGRQISEISDWLMIIWI